MSARIFRFRGTEADSDHSPDPRHTVFGGAQQPEPIGDDEREELAGANSDWPTTRRFARSAHGVDAAWPNDADYADPFERFTAASFAEQDRDVQELSWKWSVRCIYTIAVGVFIALLWGKL